MLTPSNSHEGKNKLCGIFCGTWHGGDHTPSPINAERAFTSPLVGSWVGKFIKFAEIWIKFKPLYAALLLI